MSGGAFNYAYTHTDTFAAELCTLLDERNKVDQWGYRPNEVSDQVYMTLRKIQRMAYVTAKLMREAEWLYSGDTSEELFMSRVEQIELP